MEKYLIWDTIINKPVAEATIEDYIDVNFKDRCKAFKDTELKDINGKSIYADSSIVEFKNSQLWNKYNGIFFYNKERLCYQIRIIDGVRNSEIIPYDRYSSDFKIIDTIQENKLGLIKS